MNRLHGCKKSKSIRVHFKRRSIERVGHYLDSDKITQSIQRGELKFLYRKSNNRTVFKYYDELTNRYYSVVYDKQRKKPVTIFPMRYSRKTENKQFTKEENICTKKENSNENRSK